MSNVDSQKIISVLKSEIENYDNEAKTEEVGRILSVGDGIATIYGLQHAKYGELLEFENGTEGMVLNLEQKTAYEMESRDWSSDVCSSDLKQIIKTCITENQAISMCLIIFLSLIHIYRTDRSIFPRRQHGYYG